MQTIIKQIIANILYLSDYHDVNDNTSLFKELGLSSIDYVDLCYELKDKLNIPVTLDNLWPFNKMLLDNQLFENSLWTATGWQQVCEIMAWEKNKETLSLQQLYEHFTVNYIEKRLQQLAVA